MCFWQIVGMFLYWQCRFWLVRPGNPVCMIMPGTALPSSPAVAVSLSAPSSGCLLPAASGPHWLSLPLCVSWILSVCLLLYFTLGLCISLSLWQSARSAGRPLIFVKQTHRCRGNLTDLHVSCVSAHTQIKQVFFKGLDAMNQSWSCYALKQSHISLDHW